MREEGRPSRGEQMCKALNIVVIIIIIIMMIIIIIITLIIILSSNDHQMVIKMPDIIVRWVFWISGCQMDSQARGGGGGQGQGENKVPRVPDNNNCNEGGNLENEKRALPGSTRIGQ